MVGSRTLTALAGIVLSLAISAAVWRLFDVPFLFFLVPFVPILFSRRSRSGSGEPTGGEPGSRASSVRTCPVCGFRTDDPRFEYCPRDWTRLETR